MATVPVVKICGVTRPEDGAMIAEAGADWIGLNFWPQSKRYAGVDRGREIAGVAREARPDIAVVGVFVNQPVAEVLSIAERVGCAYIQLHGDEPASVCAEVAAAGVPVIKAVAMRDLGDVARLDDHPVELLLIDTPTAGYGGSGRTFDWSLASAAVATGRRIVLAGGLRPDNVADAVAQVGPFGVDVASGVESAPGMKDATRVAEFVARAKGRADDRR